MSGLSGLQLPLLNSSQTLLVSLSWRVEGFAIKLAAAFIPACSLCCCDDYLPFSKWLSSSARVTLLLKSVCDELSALVQLPKALLSLVAVSVRLSRAELPLAPTDASIASCIQKAGLLFMVY